MIWPWRNRNISIIWVVDDKTENQIMIKRSFVRIAKHVSIVQINSCREYYGHVDNCTNANRPHIIFMDFFMGEEYGTGLVKYLREYRYKVGYPVIIGHSSNLDASAEIVRKGGDFVMEKIKGLPTSESIEKNFATLDQLRYVINHRKLKE
jgi:hypothetical protein